MIRNGLQYDTDLDCSQLMMGPSETKMKKRITCHVGLKTKARTKSNRLAREVQDCVIFLSVPCSSIYGLAEYDWRGKWRNLLHRRLHGNMIQIWPGEWIFVFEKVNSEIIYTMTTSATDRYNTKDKRKRRQKRKQKPHQTDGHTMYVQIGFSYINFSNVVLRVVKLKVWNH